MGTSIRERVGFASSSMRPPAAIGMGSHVVTSRRRRTVSGGAHMRQYGNLPISSEEFRGRLFGPRRVNDDVRTMWSRYCVILAATPQVQCSFVSKMPGAM